MDNGCGGHDGTAASKHKRCGTEFCVLHEVSADIAALMRDLLPMVEDWAGNGDDEEAAEMAERIAAILERIDGR